MRSVDDQSIRPRIPESFFEHRQSFAKPWVDKWTLPNPFLSALISPLKEIGAELADYTFNKDAVSVGDTYLNIAIRRWNAAVKIGLDSATFSIVNPSWVLTPEMIPPFDRVSDTIREVTGAPPIRQETTLALHLTPGAADFGKISALFVNRPFVGDGLFYGISIHREDTALIIDKSLRYEGAAFIRLQRRFDGDMRFVEIAEHIQEDEITAFGLLGVTV